METTTHGRRESVSDGRVLVPISASETIRDTVAYAVETATDGGTTDGYVVCVVVDGQQARQSGGFDSGSDSGTDSQSLPRETDEPSADTNDLAALLNRAVVWAEADGEERDVELTVTAETIDPGRSAVTPERLASLLADRARADDIDTIVIDPEYGRGICTSVPHQLGYELTTEPDLTVKETPSKRLVRRSPLLAGTTAIQIGTLFGISFVFYQLLAGSFGLFDLVTGAISATIVAVGLSKVALSTDPTRWSVVRLGRGIVSVPYLLWEIIKANLQLSAVVLDPRLPIDPQMTRIRPAVFGALPTMTLANSISLTAGTLTVRSDGRDIVVHTLTKTAREDLFDGGLERLIRFVFYGWRGLQIDTLRARENAEVLTSSGRRNSRDADDSGRGGDEAIEDGRGETDQHRRGQP